MKLKTSLVLLGLLAFASLTAANEKRVAGPNGGRLLELPPHKAEFFVNPEGRVQITFYDASLRPLAPEARTVTLTAEPKGNRQSIEIEKTESGFVSKTALPAAEGPYRVVVQIRENPGAAPRNFRIDLNLETCGECKRPEYACTCDH